MGGETDRISLCHGSSLGLSPRGRGNPTSRGNRDLSVGSIPAWAGKPRRRSGRRLTRRRVYPRVGGETPDAAVGNLEAGLSPRGRGNRRMISPRQRVYPRVGGETESGSVAAPRSRVYPRVGGETGQADGPITVGETPAPGLSPRGRGNRSRRDPRVGGDRATTGGSIPAWAGKPLCHNDPVSQENEYVKDRWTYGDSPAIRRIRRHTSCASGSARWRGAAVKIDSTSQAVASEV